ITVGARSCSRHSCPCPRPRQPSSSARAGYEPIPDRRARAPQAAANVLNLVMFVSNRPTGADDTLSRSKLKRKERSPSIYRDIGALHRRRRGQAAGGGADLVISEAFPVPAHFPARMAAARAGGPFTSPGENGTVR